MRARVARRHGFAAVAIAMVALLTAACGSNGAGTDASTPAKTTTSGGSTVASAYLKPPTTLPVSTPVTKPIPSGLKLIFIQGGFPQSQTIFKGLQAAAGVLGWSVSSMNYDSTNPATIPSAIQSAIAQKPAAIILNGPLVAQYASVIPQAIAAGVPLIPAATSDTAQNGVYPVINSDLDNSQVAKLLTDSLVADAQKAGVTAHVLQLTVPVVKVVLGPEDDGVASELKAKCPQCTRDLLNLNLPDVYSGKYTQQVVSYLQSHPDINYIVSDSGQLGDGLPQALQQAGLSKVVDYGVSATNVQIQQLKSGAPGAWTVQPYQVWGWIIADQVARLKIGDPTNLWENDKLGYVVTSANAEDVDPNDQEFPVGYEDMFKKMWKKQ